jgi:ABC-type ATPase with predicted acetyltransferase domain
MLLTEQEISNFVIKIYNFARTDPETSLIYSRKLAEGICQNIYFEYFNKEWRNVFDELIKKLDDNNYIPKVIILSVNTIRAFGNYSTHANKGLDKINSDNIETCITAVNTLLRWYFEVHLNIKMPEIISKCIEETTRVYREYVHPEIRLASLNDIFDWGWADQDIVNKLPDFAAIFIHYTSYEVRIERLVE